jgi:hypothetical protein
MISTTCCVKVTTGFSPEAGPTLRAVSTPDFNIAFAFMGSSVSHSWIAVAGYCGLEA